MEIGPNGCGKTTMLSKMANKELPVPASMDILYVQQEAVPDELTAFESVLAADEYRTELMAEEKEIEATPEVTLHFTKIIIIIIIIIELVLVSSITGEP